ncbi:putative RCC1 and BTB domain-containing protein 1 [Apostichopus japonicus]|uniref:Putative RCC1 and BTB domain-containing protein 1 n=1 Tax=Stichopus japonicus TaxID=307972 RepID=A0A2G8L259_STIJA|nr:putative RCC1 and BTB domain-containing protein 1 [Apostichopus japonicus]
MTNIYDVAKWPVFGLLDGVALANIKLACVFGSTGNETIYVTCDDEVFAMGSNVNGCLGVGDVQSTLTPRKIESLSKKGITSIACGSGPHVIAATEDGELYSWGHNGYCQLGNGSTTQGMVPCVISAGLNGSKVVQVSCGSHHTLVRTDRGEVYAWGYNNCGQVGSGATSNISNPRRVSATSVLVFAWGYNGNGQLGMGNNVNQPSPCRVSSLQNIIISQIVCGYNHTLALSDEGKLYAWGANAYGQLGTGNKANQVTATLVDVLDKRVVAMAAIHYSHLSAATLQSGDVYMWGQCRGQSTTSPIKTKFSCLDDVFACFSSPPVTWRPLTFENFVGRRALEESLMLAFNDENTSDISFVVEDQRIHVHKAFLKISEIEITQFTYPVYRAFLHYLYTDHVDIPPEEAISLMDLANAYCETHLKKLCERIIKQGITVNNSFHLLAAAIKYEASDLHDFCFKFCVNHLTEVVQTESFLAFEETHTKDFIIRAAKWGAFKY